MGTSRLFEIIYILQNKKKLTATELAKHFGVSRRTICRDIDTLSLTGIPIYTERGKGGGISLLPQYVLNKTILNESEQNEIIHALQSLSNLKSQQAFRALQKLSIFFNKSITDWMEIDFVEWSHENDYFNDLKHAILEKLIVSFDYFSSYGEKTFRQVEPIQLRFKGRFWYLKGFCLSKRDIRLYKLTRVKNLSVTDQSFVQRSFLHESSPPISKNLNSLKNNKIQFRIGREMAYRIYDDFYESMVEMQPDGGFLVTVPWSENEWLTHFILSYGSYIEVLEPKHLRHVIKNKAQKIVNKY